jgi:hypothetical protein
LLLTLDLILAEKPVSRQFFLYFSGWCQVYILHFSEECRPDTTHLNKPNILYPYISNEGFQPPGKWAGTENKRALIPVGLAGFIVKEKIQGIDEFRAQDGSTHKMRDFTHILFVLGIIATDDTEGGESTISDTLPDLENSFSRVIRNLRLS